MAAPLRSARQDPITQLSTIGWGVWAEAGDIDYSVQRDYRHRNRVVALAPSPAFGPLRLLSVIPRPGSECVAHLFRKRSDNVTLARCSCYVPAVGIAFRDAGRTPSAPRQTRRFSRRHQPIRRLVVLCLLPALPDDPRIPALAACPKLPERAP